MSMRQYLPSRQLTFISGSIIIAGGLILAAMFLGKSETPGSLTIEEVVAKAAELDTDGDGLKDWEESVRGTDIENQDSDFDGTSDGEEVLLGRDPLKAGPDDRAAATTTQIRLPESYGAQGDITEDVSKTFLAQYLALKAGGQLDVNAQQRLVDELTSQVKIEREVRTHVRGELTIVADGKDAFRAYGNGIITAIQNNQPGASYFSVLNAIGLALEGKEAEAGAAFRASAESYRSLIDAFTALSVPAGVAALHIEFINALERAIAPFPDMARVGSDPIRGVAGLKTYQEELTASSLVLKRIKDTFDPDGILFSENEPGYQLRTAGQAEQ